jgi:hypothetical protein
MATRPRVLWQLQHEEFAFLGALGSVRAGGGVAGRVGSTTLFRAPGPVNHGIRLDDDERFPPAWPQLGQVGPEEAVDRSQMRSSRSSVVQNRESLAKGGDLKVQGYPASAGSSRGTEQGNKDGSHAGHATREYPKKSMIRRLTALLAGTAATVPSD